MQRSRFLLAGAVLCACGSAGAQSADASSLTVFGVLDLNVRGVKNGTASTLKSESTDGLSSSRIGFRGNEELGNGVKAGFWLEAPIAPDTGTANTTRFWNRRSTVSLSQTSLGEIRLGRDNSPAFTAYAVYDPFGTNGIAEIYGNGTTTGIVSALGSGANTLGRSDNQVSYFLPAGVLGGLYGQFSIAPQENVVGNRYTAGRLGYTFGALDVSGTYTQTTVALDDKLKQAQIGAAYTFGAFKLSGQVVRATYDSLAGGDRKQMVYQLGGSYRFGNQVVRADAIYGDMSGGAAGSGFGDADDARQFALGYEYDLSKRTALYSTVSTLRNKGASQLVVAPGASDGSVVGRSSTGYEVGIRHAF